MASENPGGATGTMDPVDIEYLEWDPEGSPVSIHMNPGVADGIAHDAIEIGFAFEADTGQFRHDDVAIHHLDAVGEAAERLEEIRRLRRRGAETPK